MAADDAQAAAPEPPRPPGMPREGIRWWIEKCALPVALMLGPIAFQFMAGLQADKKHERDAQRAAEERQALQEREQSEQKFQLYTSLLSKREEADNAVRLGLFERLIGTYLRPEPADTARQLVQLEMLSLNFHDALNLNPLFWELSRQIDRSQPASGRAELLAQLDRIAMQVKERQAASLAVGAFKRPIAVSLHQIDDGTGRQPFTPVPWTTDFDAPYIDEAGKVDPQRTCHFKLTVSQKDPALRRVWVVVDSTGCDHRSSEFWVDLYDFPLNNVSRISRWERVSVMLDRYDESKRYAMLQFLYFPSSRSAAKDKPYVDDLLARLRKQDTDALAPQAAASAASR